MSDLSPSLDDDFSHRIDELVTEVTHNEDHTPDNSNGNDAKRKITRFHGTGGRTFVRNCRRLHRRFKSTYSWTINDSTSKKLAGDKVKELNTQDQVPAT